MTVHQQTDRVTTPSSSPSPSPSPSPVPKRRRRLPASAAGWIAAVLIAAAILLPLVPLVIHSFSRGYVFPQLVPAEWSTRAWRIVLATDGGTWKALGWSVVVAATVTALSLLVALPAGRVFGLRSFRGKALEFLVLAPLLVPSVAVAIGLDVTFIRLGLSGASGVLCSSTSFSPRPTPCSYWRGCLRTTTKTSRRKHGRWEQVA